MGLAIDMGTRLQLVRAASAGQSLLSVSKEYGVSYTTTCKLYKQYKLHGEGGLRTNYINCGPKGIKSNYLIYRSSCWLKRLHPTWGAPFILVQLKERYPTIKLPSARTLQRWFISKGYNQPRQKKMNPK